ncbi:MAG: hypothetical protein E6J20_00120 [Chloroflexi bacterium]|nr:MAG: hypothetical protein E6J20_00120 [Chloroflexota bacterium]
MLRTKLLAVAAVAAVAVAIPLHAAAYATNFTYSVSPTTHSAWSTVTTSFNSDPNKTLSSSETALASGEGVCHHDDTSCRPADQTKIGSATATAHWLPLCSSSTQNFDIYWDQTVDTTYTPPSGWTSVTEVTTKSTGSLFSVSFNSYVIENASGSYKIETPSYPNLTCKNSMYSANIVNITLGQYGSNTYTIHQNPSSVGSFTVNLTLTYSDSTTDTGSANFSTT